MRRRHMLLTAITAVAMFTTLGPVAAGAAGAAGPSQRAVRGAQLWVARYDGRYRYDAATAMAVSPGGRRVFVTGQSAGRTTGSDYATVAYSAATGRQLWVRRYNGSGNG